MTKNIIKFAFLLISLVAVVACNDNNDAVIGFNLDKTEINIGPEGGKEIIYVETEESWVATTNVPWITISPANGIGTTGCEILIDSSLTNDMRPATIRFTPSVSQVSSIDVKQFGFSKQILVKDSVVTVESSAKLDDRFFEAEITSNVQFDVEFDFLGNQEWISTQVPEIELDRGARPRTTKLRFDWKMNTVPEERVAEVKLIPVNKDDILDAPAIISVLQKPAVKIEDNRTGDSLALVVINERLNCWSDVWDTGENLQYWQGVKLWEPTDTFTKSHPEAIGRVRSVEYFLIDTEESIPAEIKHLKYLESLSISSNINTMLLNIELGPEICDLEYLKSLRLFSYGLVSLPDELAKLKNLEVLSLDANNFAEIPAVLTPNNFPNLKSLSFVGSRRWTISDLRKKDDSKYEDGIGLNFNTDKDDALRRLLLWDNLEELALSNCYIEGSIPDFTVGEDGVKPYTDEDVKAWGGDTIKYLAENKVPKILPKCVSLRLNLNYFTGELPQWMLYHPYLLEWIPELLIFNQNEKGINSDGKVVGFDNVPPSFEYYYTAFPDMREKYELKDEFTNE